MEKWEIPQFKFRSIPNSIIRDEWVKYKRNFQYIAAANEEKNATRLKNVFLAKAGPDVQEVFASLPGADVEEDKAKNIDPFKVAIEKLDEYFSPKQHEAFERNTFWNLKPQDEETMEKFLWRTLEVAQKCNFGTTLEESRSIAVIDKVILYAPVELKQQLLQKEKLTLDDVTRVVSSYESVKKQSMLMEGKSGSTPAYSEHGGGGGQKSELFNVQSSSRGPPTTGECYRCGHKDHYGNDPRCPARSVQCTRCKRYGHFSKRCKTEFGRRPTHPQSQNVVPAKRPGGSQNHWDNKKPKYNPRHERIAQVEDNTSDPDENTSFVYNISDGDEFIWVKVGGVLIQMLIDSGSAKNILDDRAWEHLRVQGAVTTNFRTDCDQIFRAYGRESAPLKIVCVFEADIAIDGAADRIEGSDTFYVVEGGTQPLLGRTTAKKLGVLKIGLSSVNAGEVQERRPFPKMKDIKLIVPVDESVTPVVQNVRRPPIALLTRVEEKLDQLLASEIIEPVKGKKGRRIVLLGLYIDCFITDTRCE